MSEIPAINARLRKIIDDKYFGNVSNFAESIGVVPQKVNRLFNVDRRTGKFPNLNKTDIVDRLRDTNKDISITWLLTGEGEMIKMEGRSLEENFSVQESVSRHHTNELIEKSYNGATPVRVVTTKARAGWSDAYYSDEYLADMPLITIETDENYKGEYLAFEVDGDSMEPEYFPGDIVICRTVKRDLWQYKLHYEQYDFVIAHSTRGIMLKEIVNHDTETGMITCHSLNPDHVDFTVNLREVAYLYNVVEVRQSGKSKKRRR